ncbi:hypothetical protein C0991_009695, partial [Blastosporella zonata]
PGELAISAAQHTEEEFAEQVAQELLEDQHIVNEELKQYEDARILPLLEQLCDLTWEWE